MEQVGVEVEVFAAPPLPVPETLLDESGFVDFAVTGTRVSGEFRCAECGYGAVVHRVLPHCPMCSGAVWERRGPLARRPLD